MFPTLNLAFVRRNDHRLGTGIIQRLSRLGQLDLLKTFGN
jgi:hypothetical protein